MGNQENKVSVSSVLRVFGIVEELAKEQTIAVSDLANRMEMSKSTVFRFLQTMKDLGYVAQDEETEKYSLTLKMFQVGSHVLNIHDLTQIANKYMLKLAELTQETVHLSILDIDSKSIIYIHKINAVHSQTMLSRIGAKAPIYCTALGKVLLTFCSEEVKSDVIAGLDFRKLTPFTIDNELDFKKELEKIKSLGYAEDVGEREEQLYCIAVPIFDRFNQVVAGISITWTAFRFEESLKGSYLDSMKHAARKISEELGNFSL